MKQISMKVALPLSLLTKMKDVQEKIGTLHDDPKQYNEEMRLFYDNIAFSDHWQSIILCLLYREAQNNRDNVGNFEEILADTAWHIPMYRSGREPEADIMYLFNDVFKKLSSHIRVVIAEAINAVVERFTETGNEEIISSILGWDSFELLGIISPVKLLVIINDERFSTEVRQKAYASYSSKTSFEFKATSKELKTLCEEVGFPLSVYLAAMADRFLNDRNEDFYRHLRVFTEAADTDFPVEDDSNVDSIRSAFISLAVENGMNVHFGEAQSGLGLLLNTYEKCCQAGKQIIFNSIEEIKVGMQVRDEDYIVGCGQRFVRVLSEEEKGFFNLLLAKDLKKMYED